MLASIWWFDGGFGVFFRASPVEDLGVSFRQLRERAGGRGGKTMGVRGGQGGRAGHDAGGVQRHVALLRGINVGGRHVLPMKDLVELFVVAGCEDVRTYIQSGNVVFSAGAALARRVPALIQASILERFGFEARVVLRKADELRAAVEANPFADVASRDPKKVHLALLSKPPTRAKVAALDHDRSPPDEFVVRGAEIYLHFPRGLARSKLTNLYFDRCLETTSTMRNWSTILKLVALL